ncbi:hypothetical protein HPB50_021626 [Hyalomma asiaticum]|uniref:Uncharacterized protein n=1 Tax=Hyalomma asiaticum TaxID=266040 RepID=A0ACB7SAB7_HYAAI|nr:hypothetical protein HPB50_021626 [Hyalomma asiaticum]
MWYDSLQSVNKTWPEGRRSSSALSQRQHRDMEDRIYRRGEPIEAYYYDKMAKALHQSHQHPHVLLSGGASTVPDASRTARRNRWLAEFKPLEGE